MQGVYSTTSGRSWEFLINTLKEKTASELGISEFTRRIKKIVDFENDIPGYLLKFSEDQKKVIFTSITKPIKIN